MPQRVQYKGRRPGQKMPPGARYVGRHTRAARSGYGRFGNPFDVDGCIEAGFATTKDEARAVCVDRHRRWLAGDPDLPDVVHLKGRAYDRRDVLASLGELRGKDLACWCPEPAPGQPDVCHGATLLKLANTPRLEEVS